MASSEGQAEAFRVSSKSRFIDINQALGCTSVMGRRPVSCKFWKLGSSDFILIHLCNSEDSTRRNHYVLSLPPDAFVVSSLMGGTLPLASALADEPYQWITLFTEAQIQSFDEQSVIGVSALASQIMIMYVCKPDRVFHSFLEVPYSCITPRPALTLRIFILLRQPKSGTMASYAPRSFPGISCRQPSDRVGPRKSSAGVIKWWLVDSDRRAER
ncbi:hypothetical protein AVEN_71094-1 [Araneus ventricosus]|uniref:Uncharacterized protein n=1 Tax=Araneus ventricosus TaxID=182803 RepID=A0A4Y2TSU3_ARAVE|nr:hypothetical protein AVEN_71094-1 [Araneus ventricosus]